METYEQKIEIDAIVESLGEEERGQFENCLNILKETVSMYGEIGLLALASLGVEKSSEAEQYAGLI